MIVFILKAHYDRYLEHMKVNTLCKANYKEMIIETNIFNGGMLVGPRGMTNCSLSEFIVNK